MSSPDTSGYLKQWAEMRYIMERANAWNKYDSKKKAEVFDFAVIQRLYLISTKTIKSLFLIARQKENV